MHNLLASLLSSLTCTSSSVVLMWATNAIGSAETPICLPSLPAHQFNKQWMPCKQAQHNVYQYFVLFKPYRGWVQPQKPLLGDQCRQIHAFLGRREKRGYTDPREAE
eukprot:1162142-Pelagomonas_calceolata.AAC.16